MAGKNFDFQAYNDLMKNAGTGLQLHLAVQSLKNVWMSLEHFDNPLADDASGLVQEAKVFQAAYKLAAKQIADARTNGQTG